MAQKEKPNQEGSTDNIKSASSRCEGNRSEESIETVVKFSPGRIVRSDGVITRIPFEETLCALFRHVFGDWGDVDASDWEKNEFALANGLPLLSRYRSESGVVFWIITEHDRSVTTIFLPIEY